MSIPADRSMILLTVLWLCLGKLVKAAVWDVFIQMNVLYIQALTTRVQIILIKG